MLGRRIGRAFLGQLASGLDPLGTFGRRVGRSFLRRLVSELFPFGALGSSRLTRGAGPGPKVPTTSNYENEVHSCCGDFVIFTLTYKIKAYMAGTCEYYNISIFHYFTIY